MKEKIFKNFTLKILSIIVAVILWTVIVNIYDPSTSYTFSNVTVTLLNTENLTDKNYSYEVVEGSKISVSVSGPKSIITDITASDIVATADLSNVTAYSDYVDIKVSVVKDGNVVEGVEATPKTTAIKLSIENRTTTTFTLESQTTGNLASGYALSNVTLSPTSVDVTGASSVIESIAHAVVSIDLTDASSNLTGDSAITLYDEDYNVVTDDTIELSQASASYSAEIGKTKVVPIKVETTGTPATGYILVGVTQNQSEATIAGSSEDIEGVDAIVIPSANLNIEGFSNNREYKFNLSNYVSNDVTIISDGTLIVTVDIEPQESKVITMDKSAIVVKGLSDDLSLTYSDSGTFDITITGASEVLNSVSASNIAMSIDLSGYQEGTYSVAVTITLPTGCSLQGSYTVSISLKSDTEATTASG